MGLQVVVKAESVRDIEVALGDFLAESELFRIADGQFGLSIPTKVVDSLGEQLVFGKLANVEYYELWSGKWHKPAQPLQPKKKWKLW